MRALRDRSLSSRILILLEIRRRPPSTLRPVAVAVGISQQAVSGYLKQLVNDGLATRSDGTWRITPAGEDFLRLHIRALKRFADDVVRDLVLVESCSAIAAAPIRKGDRVALTMADGRLVATPGRRSGSWGVAVTDGDPGRDVTVGELRGIVRIQEASLTVIDVPGPKEGGSSALEPGWLAKALDRMQPPRVGALDEAAEGALRRTGAVWHLEFAPLHSAAAAVERGMSPVYVGSPESVGFLLADIELAKSEGKLARFSYEVVRAPRRRRGAADRSARRRA